MTDPQLAIVGDLQTGDTLTIAGVYEPEGVILAVKRWLGFRMPPRRLQEFMVTMSTPRSDGDRLITYVPKPD